MAHDFDNLNVIVTGGAGALGRAVVLKLLDQGARIAVPCVDAEELTDCPFVDDPRVTIRMGVDLTDEAAVRDFYEQAGPLWASIQVAGGFAMSPIDQTTAEAFQKMWSINALTCLLSCREAVGSIRRTGQGGRLVNVTAKPALTPAGGLSAYVASKGAVAAFTRGLAEELAAENIWVNAVAPSIMDTPANRRAMPDADHDAWPDVADVAATIVFLASPANRVTRGAIVPVYGRS